MVTNVSNPGSLKAVKVPVWSTQGGQDDIIGTPQLNKQMVVYKKGLMLVTIKIIMVSTIFTFIMSKQMVH